MGKIVDPNLLAKLEGLKPSTDTSTSKKVTDTETLQKLEADNKRLTTVNELLNNAIDVKVIEVPKRVEVPKVIEKEVIKEVPVDKVAIKEIPVEVVRKELVHVPFYATEHGVVDATSILNNDPKPVLPLSKENKREEDDAIEGEFQSQISPNGSASSTEQNLTKKDSPTPKKTQTRKKVAGTTTKKATAKTARNKKS